MSTCLETFATLRIFSNTIHPDEIGRQLEVAATIRSPIDSESKYKHRRETHYWGWSTENLVTTVNGEDHLRALIATLEGKERQLAQLRADGCEIDVCCYWVSTGQGGPSLDNDLILALGRLGLSIWWDIYFGKEKDHQNGAPSSVTSRA